MQRTPLKTVGPTKVVTFPHLAVKHGCSTRVGGVSQAPWDTLNTGFTVGDDPAAVWQNRRRFAACLGVDNLTWFLSMSHGKEVAQVQERPPLPSDQTAAPRPFYSADACITNQPGIPLNLTVADCVPVFFHDPKAGCIGLAHAGWRGTVAGIVTETVLAMGRAYGSQAKDVLVGIGPSIGPQKFEVGSEVVDEFQKAFPDHPDLIASLDQPGKALIDLWRANTVMALRAGVPEQNVIVSGWCTVSHPDLFFSHRRDQGQSGRLLAGIIL
jgi:YfiH family protein